ncbi:DNA mismatch repair protein MutL [Pasteurellaceae bacterium Pebbles2]|nr:DNA mismatch repair protein MutL [Pasteurellaceae bacterium Pebbles2]
MPIQILPAQLANQIAAGEVVERPASVVKELVENSLDAGATRIQIDIENGGASLIRIRDNGIGIAKQELSLALARHATSKISCIEDLEAILSLGFRGEALASISSVSRLTLTSRTAEQNEAWQVYVQGRDQESTITPASHPVGTTVEVANLFFNTPARRKFLRTDKTEFAHIDEVIRRIALAKSHIAFTLTHNGKILRQYKSAVETSQVLKRVAAICGEDFVHNALHIDWKHDDLHLSGWVATAQFTRTQNDLSYCYINGRMVKDKVITHAIRQAYAEHLPAEQHPAFVLFLDINPNDVDVNVHPTKHEVRFHQARLVHDFICQGVSNALQQAEQFDFNPAPQERISSNEVQELGAHYAPSLKPNRSTAGVNMFSHSVSTATSAPASTASSTSPFGNEHSGKKSSHFTPHFSPQFTSSQSLPPSKTEQKIYGELLHTEQVETNHHSTQPHILRALALVHLAQKQALLLQQNDDFYLLPLDRLQKVRSKLQLKLHSQLTQPLLIPVVFRLDAQQQENWLQQKTYFAQLGFQFSEHLAQHRITLNAVPQHLRQQNLQKIIVSLLAQQFDQIDQFSTALLTLLEQGEIAVFASAVNMLQEVEQLINQQQDIQLQDDLIAVDFNLYLQA